MQIFHSKFFKKSVRSFIITKDKKNLIIYWNNRIEIHEINKMKLKSFYKRTSYDSYMVESELYLIDEFTFALQLEHSPMTIMEPPDILLIFDFKDINNIKFVGRIPLETYDTGIFTKEKMFFSSWQDHRKGLIYTYQNLMNIIKLVKNEILYSIKEINKNEECKPYIIEFKKNIIFFMGIPINFVN